MNCADLLCLARAAPEPAPSTRVYTRTEGDSFDKFLKVESSERISNPESSSRSRVENREETRSVQNVSEKEKIEPMQVKEKPVEKTDARETGDMKAEDETVKEVLAAAVAAQVLIAVSPVEIPKETVAKAAAGDTNVPAAAVPVQQNTQTPVIQLPDAEPQPLPDELKQAVQQPKVEVKEFATLVEAAAKNLDTQAAKATEGAAQSVAAKPENQELDMQEPAVKVVEIKAQPEDLSAVQSTRNNAGLYAVTAAKSENLIQPKTLPMIREISQEVVNLAREQGKSLRIQVSPENMGKIDLRLISNSDGLRVVMTTEIPATGKLLESHLDNLQRSLGEAGLSISGMSVNSQGAQDQAKNQSFQQMNLGQVRNTRPSFNEEPIEVSRPVPVTVSATGLDYRI